ncbi:helix-turn-helix transcriptional regulator [Archangium violaceum]|uniref:helix-turn-helix domain-containing protein n=1 Tax=Archangium violaceum TaxID=83451 RepID=UPI00193C4FFB|nr:helix-turn-helix transcriptional regulator [Archangium violaceum]QRK05262.1 helix-turn-helix transcriptional regulator [Archangium violaceum]
MDAIAKRFLGKTARAARLRLGLTQAQVAQRLDMAVGVYGRIERGGMMPSIPTVLRLCRVLKLDANALLGFSSPTPPPWFAPQRPTVERAAVRDLLRIARRLGPRQRAALGGMARAMLLSEGGPDAGRAATHTESGE